MNNRKAKVFDYSTKTFTERMWQDIEVGNFIKVQKDESFPCDILFVKCAAKNVIAFVDTMNLDGEVSFFFYPISSLPIKLPLDKPERKNSGKGNTRSRRTHIL